ncbi:MAG: glutamate--tRNA ligase [Actinomycetota bacterium]|nr:glutamate--tRNA ligase [Actinomycetota bacterium]
MKPRVRFAPSPTGFLHVGSARTALFNWLYARATGGSYILRIEDTDQERNRPELTEQLLEELDWLGLDWDEGPIYQSEKLERHREVVQTFLENGFAYLCDDENREVEGTGLTEGLAVRFRMPQNKTISFNDLVRGEVVFNTDDLEDFVIWRSNGSPMFLLANAVDDADMGITHAIRGEDLLSGVPKVLLLLDAMGAQHPIYAHLPLLVNEQRKKLSKRRDDVAVGDYREKGFLPEAMVNYLALLGWGPPDGVEIRSLAEIVEIFNIEDVNKAAAFFDIQKFEHVNSSYLRNLSKEDFMERVEPWIGGETSWPKENFDPEKFSIMADLIQEKLRTLSDTPRFVDFLFLDAPEIDENSWKKTMKDPQTVDTLLGHVAESFEDCAWETDVLKHLVTKAGEEVDLKLGKAQAPLRVAVTGRTVGPPLFETMACCMTREEVLKRISDTRKSL